MPTLEVPIEYLHECPIYDADTGELRWKPQISKARNGCASQGKSRMRATQENWQVTRLKGGYLGICLTYAGKTHVFKAHRIAFAIDAWVLARKT